MAGIRRCWLLGWSMAAILAATVAAATETDAAPRHLERDGLARSYLVHRPAGLDRAVPVPLVIMLHGGFGTARQAQASYGWNAVADRAGFVVAYPDGIGHSWNAGGMCCGPALKRNIDDVGFLDQLIRELAAAENIDPRRIYLTGMSNGAAMSYRYACEGRQDLAAIGPVAGTLSYACAQAHPVSVLAIHGLDDANVPFAGGAGSKGVTPGRWQPVPATLELLRDAARCAPATTTRDGPLQTTDARCAQGRAVVLVTIAGAGHQWPGSARKGLLQHLLGGDPPSTALDATEALWTFFNGHPAPP